MHRSNSNDILKQREQQMLNYRNDKDVAALFEKIYFSIFQQVLNEWESCKSKGNCSQTVFIDICSLSSGMETSVSFHSNNCVKHVGSFSFLWIERNISYISDGNKRLLLQRALADEIIERINSLNNDEMNAKLYWSDYPTLGGVEINLKSTLQMKIL